MPDGVAGLVFSEAIGELDFEITLYGPAARTPKNGQSVLI